MTALDALFLAGVFIFVTLLTLALLPGDDEGDDL